MDKHPPLPLGQIIERVKRNVAKSKRAKRLDTVERRWAEVAGPAVAAATKVKDLTAGVAVIEVDSSPLKAELETVLTTRPARTWADELNAAGVEGNEAVPAHVIRVDAPGTGLARERHGSTWESAALLIEDRPVDRPGGGLSYSREGERQQQWRSRREGRLHRGPPPFSSSRPIRHVREG